MKLPTLYKKGKTGETCEWSVHTTTDKIIETYGRTEGKLQTNTRQAKPKNVGRSNATTGPQQAELEAKAKWQHKKDKGYVESLTTAKKTERIYTPMLAGDFTKRKDKVEYPVYVQPKLDGVRCLSHLEDRVFLMSRGNKEYNVPHIADEVKAFLKGNKHLYLDGELFVPGKDFQEASRLVKKQRENSTDLEYHIYDAVDTDNIDATWEERMLLLSKIFKKANFEHIKLVQSVQCHTINSINKVHDHFVHEGYEGAIIRVPSGTYEFGHRSLNLLKLKTFKDDEFKVIGYEKGERNCVVWLCKLSKGDKQFKVYPTGTIEHKQHLLKHAEKYIGLKLKVKYQELSRDGIPRFPVGLGFRLKED